MTVVRAYQSLDEALKALERTRFELSQSEITRQLQARDLVRQTDEAREYRLQRDEAEAKVAALTQVQADTNGALLRLLANENQALRQQKDDAVAAATYTRTRP